MMGHLGRGFAFRVRPHHRETLASYTSRVLAANFEPETLRTDLIREFENPSKAPASGGDKTWLDILTSKTGRQLHFNADASGWCTHADGSSCRECIDLIAARWVCTRCTYGAIVEQYPHFDRLICTRHHRWVGVRTVAEDQRQIGRAHHSAARRFARLRRANRLDVRLYLILQESLTGGRGSAQSEAQAFPDVVKLAAAITSPSFLASFLDPATTFTTTYASLRAVVSDTLGRPHPRVTRAIWLYMRPTVASYRNAHNQGISFKPAAPHDFPASIQMKDHPNAGSPQAFPDYLRASHDTAASALEHGLHAFGRLPHAVDLDTMLTCPEGHHYTPVPVTAGQKSRGCPSCNNRPPAFGNDLHSASPDVATELDPFRNGGLTAMVVAARSSRKLFWLCPAGHSYPATPNNRTLNSSLCPVCTKRLIIPGTNDLATSHPQLAAEFHPSELSTRPPSQLPAGTNTTILWLCPAGHTYRMPVIERVGGRYCPTCTATDTRAGKLTIAQTHPRIAQEWHPTKNYGRTPSDRSHGSKVLAWWLCPNGHSYSQRIERRTAAGYGCPICSNRKLATGTNDLASTEPIMTREWHPTRNKRAATDTMSIDKLFYWLCLARGHEHLQTVDHRRKSLGCPLCPKDQRILFRDTDSAVDA